MADEDFAAVEKKALQSGASKVYVIDLQVPRLNNESSKHISEHRGMVLSRSSLSPSS